MQPFLLEKVMDNDSIDIIVPYRWLSFFPIFWILLDFINKYFLNLFYFQILMDMYYLFFQIFHISELAEQKSLIHEELESWKHFP